MEIISKAISRKIKVCYLCVLMKLVAQGAYLDPGGLHSDQQLFCVEFLLRTVDRLLAVVEFI